MRRLLFYAFWILIALALPYSLKAQSELPSCALPDTTGIEAHGADQVAK